MKFLIALWNGPFHIGKLSQPVTVGDVLLKVLETLWRLLVLLAGAIFLAGAALVAWIYVIEPMLFPPAKSKVEIRAEYDDGTGVIITNVPPPGADSTSREPPKPFRCNKEYPIKVTFMNLSGKSITDINFSLEAFLPNSSRNYMKSGNWFNNDIIIAPHSGWINCYSSNFDSGIDGAKLQFRSRVWSARYH